MGNQNFTIIHSYTRAQALEDGVLFDVTLTAKEAGFRVPTAISSNLYARYIKPSEETREHGQSTLGRLWDVLMVFRVYAHRSGSQRVLFPVQFVTGTRQDGSPRNETVQVLGLLHSGDTREPVITIMLPEDE